MSGTFGSIARALLKNGYTPLPLVPGQKYPTLKNWSQLNYAEAPHLLDELCGNYPNSSTGILLGTVCVVDLDVLDKATAERCRDIVTAFGVEVPCRFGRYPKSAFFFRVRGPSFKKLLTGVYEVNGQKAQVEILCDGQQVVISGIHPDTQKPYYWSGKDLLETPLSELPEITCAGAENLLQTLEAELATAASGNREKPSGSPKSREGRNGFLFSKGCALRTEGADGEAIRAELEALNLTATVEDHPNFADGPLPANELSQVVASVLKFEVTDPRKEEQELLTRMNQKHAVVMVGGKCVIANEEFDPSWGHDTVTFSSEADLIRRYANRRVGHGKSQTTEGRAWLTNPGRRQFDGVVFAPGKDTPGYLNLDRGFAVEPRHGDCSLFLDHVRNNICRCDEDLSDYLLAWMADCVQNRSRRTGISVVLRGRQGTGKGVLCSQFGALFGRHFIQVTQAGHLTGNFNSHLKDKLLVHADEAFWAGDKKAEGVLKALITEDTIQIEMKGKDVVTFRNHIRLIVSSNNEWVVPAGNEERRFFILDVCEARMQDRAYFGSIIAQMNNGGREALLQYLLDYDLSATDVGSPPKTDGLMDQKAYSASPLQAWWYERLVDGHITSERTKWDTEIPTDTLHEDYITFCQKQGIKRPKPPSAFGKELKALVPELERARPSNKNSRKYVYRLGELDVCRRNFDRLTMSSHDWDEADH